MSVQSWQIVCPRCRWSNSGAERRCGKCGQPLRTAPGLLVAGESGGNIVAPKAPPRRVVQAGGFFPRLIAVIIDTLILGVILVPVYYLWRAQLSQVHLDPNAVNQTNALTDQLHALGGSALAGSSFQQLTQVGELLLGYNVVLLFYFVGSWTILSGSPGQLVMSLRVVDPSAHGIGFGRALMRFVFKGLFSAFAPISALLVAVGKDKRALHDLFAGTYVIQYLDPQHASQNAGALPPAVAPAPARQVSPQARATTPAGAALAAAAIAQPVLAAALAPQPTQAAARAASAAERAAKVAAPAAAAAAPAASLAEPAALDPLVAPAAPATTPATAAALPLLSILPEPAVEPAPAPFYAVPAPSRPDESSFERYTPPPMPGPPSSAPLGAPAPPIAQPAPAPTAPAPAATPAAPQEESMPLPPLPPPAPAPESAEPTAASAANPPDAGPQPAITALPSDPYPVPFAPLPPVANRPEPPVPPAPPEE